VDVQHTNALSISAPQISVAESAAVKLRLGAVVAARVIEGPGPDGRGLLSLAGVVVRAKLPHGLHVGDRLRLHVAGRDGDQLVLRRVAEERPSTGGVPASVVAELAESGDGDQLRAALALAGGPIPLPGGRVLTVEPDAGEESSRREQPDEGSVRVVLHSPALGALELQLGLHGGALDVNVVADAAVTEAASAALPELREAVLSSTGLAAHVEVLERRGAAPPAPAVVPVEEVRRYG
jgi:hypothetical protein